MGGYNIVAGFLIFFFLFVYFVWFGTSLKIENDKEKKDDIRINPYDQISLQRKLIDIKEDGTFKLDMSYFKYHRGFRMTGRKFNKLFGRSPRKGETELSQFHMDIAASIQAVTEEVVLKLARSLREETGIKNLCLAGGVALNCVSNGKLLRAGIFDDIYIQPAAGDAGGAS